MLERNPKPLSNIFYSAKSKSSFSIRIWLSGFLKLNLMNCKDRSDWKIRTKSTI